MPTKIHACPGINKSTERRPRVPEDQSAVLSTIEEPLKLALLPEPASSARDEQKVAQYDFSALKLQRTRKVRLGRSIVPFQYGHQRLTTVAE